MQQWLFLRSALRGISADLETAEIDLMTTAPDDFARSAASAFNRRDLEAMLALVSEDFAYLDDALLMPSASANEG